MMYNIIRLWKFSNVNGYILYILCNVNEDSKPLGSIFPREKIITFDASHIIFLEPIPVNHDIFPLIPSSIRTYLNALLHIYM